MTLINLRNLGVTLGAPLFSNLNFAIVKGDRTGLVAANGRGKSTLLRVLAGDADASHGDITRARGLRVGLVTQDVPEALQALPLHQAVLTALSDEQARSEAWRVDIALNDLAVPDELWEKPLRALSGGWQRVALLARAWVAEPDLLLMDEPTNHLDLGRIGILQGWLDTVARNTPFLVASHDRAFLDATTNRTLFLRSERSQLFARSYSEARAALDEADAAEGRQFANELAKVSQLRRQAAKLKNIGINSGSDLLLTKTKRLNERAEKIEEAARPAFQERSAGAIRLTNSGIHSKALVSLDNADIQTPDGRTLFRTGALWINRGDRVVVLGANGTGKTRLLSQVIRALAEPDPRIRVAPSVVPGISDQALQHLDRFRSPMDAVAGRRDVNDRAARALLADAGMSVAIQDGKIAALSGGQRARLSMLLLRLEHPNFYILDEPTNHLDIEGQEALEHELLAHDATALLVSHDRAFVRQVGTRFWQIVRNRLVEVDDPEAFFALQLG
ncbi:ATP-binding cassette domain-containing protein [Kaistia granuli]|uniref:ATP-binding cassette domain-containing protein n=1 Tax=Kaistia granuli TaxID=363259 RepID=UPI0003666733|nr:ABC-F family ATP-binding cassette domain-containing protein [Kaistia granuli]